MSSALFSPYKLAGLELANRIVVSPMCQYSADDGCANDWHLMHLGMLANSGAALVIVEATHVERQGRITHGCLGLYSDDNEAALARVIASARRAGTAKFGIQIAHAGRKASAQKPWEGAGPLAPDSDPWPTMAASPIPFGDNWHTPREVTEADMERVRAGLRHRQRSAPCASASTRSNCTWRTVIWRTASCRQSPTSAPTTMAARLRTGCAFRSRSRARCAALVPKGVPLGARITGSDWRDGGLTADDAVAICQGAQGRGHRLHLHLVGRRRRRHPQSGRARLQRADRRARAKGSRHPDPLRRADRQARACRADRGQRRGRHGVDGALFPGRSALGLARRQGAWGPRWPGPCNMPAPAPSCGRLPRRKRERWKISSSSPFCLPRSAMPAGTR